VTAGGVAAAATGVAVSSGVVLGGGAGAAATAASAPSTSMALPGAPVTAAASSRPSRSTADLAEPTYDRTRALSRSLSRTASRTAGGGAVDPVKRQALDQRPGGQVTRTENLATGDPRDIARRLLPRFGFGAGEFGCLDAIYSQESGWDVHADNPASSAYGIPQALPGDKMAAAGPNWQDDAATQIRWGLGYIQSSYGSPCSAWSFKQGHGWY
jgi:hypothetical protein